VSDPSPIPLIWRDGVFIPATQRQGLRCKEQFEEGKKYLLVEQRDRSIGSHNHYFAALNEAWMNLPEGIEDEFPTFEKFRATGLIATGFYDERQLICATPEEARRIAAFMRRPEDLSIVSVNGCAVVERTAKSQSWRAMDKVEFRKSKETVLAWTADLCGVEIATLTSNAGQAA